MSYYHKKDYFDNFVTYGTTLLDNNVDDSFVAEQMGHKDVNTTRKLYYYSNKRKKQGLSRSPRQWLFN